MDHVLKPRCRAKRFESGNVLWTVYGLGVEVISFKGIDHAVSHWFNMVTPKLLKGIATA